VTIVRRVQPSSQPPPAGGRRRVPAPSGGGSGRGPSPCTRRRDAGGTPVLPGRLHRAVCAPRMGPAVNIRPRRGGETGFPHPSADAGRRPAHPGPGPWEGLGGRSPPKKNLVSSRRCAARAAWTAEVNIRPRRGGWGNRVSPRPRPREGAGAARAQGDGETGFPHPPTRWEGVGGRSSPRKDVHPVGVRRSRMDG